MRIYQVGGSVRDELLGLPAKDRDFVVVGATLAQFRARFPDAVQVGKSFPVFLVGGREYAFARIERKTAPGHTGFAVTADPGVTLEEDLARRDLTINAMARDLETGEVIDPHGGRADLVARRLAHVGPAFVEDPLRAYRLARFAAQLPEFEVAPDTLNLAARLAPELPCLSADRVWQEFERALDRAAPGRFVDTLWAAGLLPVHFAELAHLAGQTAHPDGPAAADALAQLLTIWSRLGANSPGTLRFAALGAVCSGPAATAAIHGLATRLPVPNRFRSAGEIVAGHLAPYTRLGDPAFPAAEAVITLRAVRRFPDGPEGFARLAETARPGLPATAHRLAGQAGELWSIRLPKEDQNRGRHSAERLLDLQAARLEEWRRGVG